MTQRKEAREAGHCVVCSLLSFEIGHKRERGLVGFASVRLGLDIRVSRAVPLCPMLLADSDDFFALMKFLTSSDMRTCLKTFEEVIMGH